MYKCLLNEVKKMSLFKIFRGKAERLSQQTLTDGYAYFTPDDGGFYKDADDGQELKSIKVNDINEKIDNVLIKIKVEDEQLNFPTSTSS